MSARSQKVLLWWSVAMVLIYAFALRFLLHMLPPPTATWSSSQIAQFYSDHSTEVKLGAVICSWTGGWFVPFAVVVGIQMYRHNRVWGLLAGAAGVMLSIFIVLSPFCWGVAAFTPSRQPDVTAIMHEFGVLGMVTTLQYFIFVQIAVVVVCLTPNSVAHSPFPRWFGYATAWLALVSEVGAIAFLTRRGPFAWNGLLAWWAPLTVFGIWFTVLVTMLIKSINAQAVEAESRVPVSRTTNTTERQERESQGSA
jgi:hypothetical protein